MQVEKNKVVSIDYTLRDGNGAVMDSSEGHEPLAYVHGVGGIIPGLEQALEGRSPGENLNVQVPPEQAYGNRDEALVQSVPRTAFRGVDNIQQGMQFQASAGGQSRVVTVVGVDDQNVQVDANHPLAGKTLNFDVTVRDVRDATPDELQHGHAHGPGGAHH
ncbi:MAG TPA: peptidylprolyl isomerase [Tepidisphaeraceae bacterium]|nr:peptidylprolyl isomerase [Tepidisphaeraceae bacterium]